MYFEVSFATSHFIPRALALEVKCWVRNDSRNTDMNFSVGFNCFNKVDSSHLSISAWKTKKIISEVRK